MRTLPLILLLTAVPAISSAQTTVPSGNLVGSQTWTAANSPYILQGDLTVPTGITLTLEAGAVVHLGPGDDLGANLDTNRTELRIAGTLTVNGTAMSPAILRSGATTPATSDFHGLVVLSGGSVNATSLQIERAHRGVLNQATGAVFNDLRLRDCSIGFNQTGGSSTVNGGEVLRSTSYGVSLSGGTFAGDGLQILNGSSRGLSASGTVVDLSDSVIAENNSYGVYMTSGSSITNSTLNHNTIYGNNSYGLYFTGSSNNRIAVRNNLVSNNRTYGMYRTSSAQVTASYNLTYSNGTNYSGVSAGAGALTENPLLVDGPAGNYAPTSNSGARMAASDGMDIGAVSFGGVATTGLVGHLYANLTLTAAASPHTVLGDLTVEPGVTLTIEAGAQVRFTAGSDVMGSGDSSTRTELRVEGTLTAIGTAANRVLLTSTGTGRGDWYGLRLLGTAAGSTVDYTTIRYAQYAIRSSAPATNTVRRTELTDASSYALWKDGDAVTFDQMDIHDNASRGVSVSGASGGGVTDSLIYDNPSYGIYATSGSAISNLSVTGNTIVDNNSYGAYFTGSSNNRVTLRNNIIVGNRTYGVYRTSSAQVTASYNLVWDNGTNYSGVSAGAGAISENPLFADQANEDFRITSNSPARTHGSGGVDMGALTYDGTATAGLLGHLYADTLLSQANSPHMVQGDLTIEPGVTLTIEPGATLQFSARADTMGAGASSTRAELRVLGTLVADGTISRNITFTSDAASRSRGDWYGVHFLSTSNASIIDYATIEFAQYGVRSSAPAGTSIQRSTIRESSSYAVWGDGGAATFSQLVVRDNASRGFSMNGASGAITDCVVHDNSSYGIYATSGSAISNLSVIGNTVVDNNSYGVYFTGSSNNRITLRNNIIANNRTYGVYRTSSAQVTASYNLVWSTGTSYSGVSQGAGAISENPLFVNPANGDYRVTSRSPARMHASDGTDVGALAFDGAVTVGEQGHLFADTTWAASASPITVLGDITVEPGVTLTIEPGVTVNFAPSSDSMMGNSQTSQSELIVEGRLQVNGTAANRVLLTSAARGNWYGVHLRSTAANSSIRNTHIRFARFGLRSSAPASASITQSEISESSSYQAQIDGGALVMDGVYIHDGSSRGISVQGAAPSISNCVIADNASYGVYVTSGSGIQNTALNHLTIDGNNSYGAYFTGSSNNRVTLRNSSITNNRTYGVYRTSSAQVTAGRNNVWTNGTNYSGVSQGSGSISANPQFVNTMLGNYQLLPSSTLIDAADPATAASSDLTGAMRPLDGDNNMSALPDLGAFEFNPSSNRFPVADAGPDRVATSGLAISFDGSGSTDPDGTIANYAWDFGDGTTGTGAMVSHTFTGGTDRTVTLTVTDNAGAVDVDTVFVEVNLPPVAEAGPPRFGDPGEIINLTGSGSTDSDGTVVSYAWNFGDGTTGTGISVTHQYATPGNFTVTLTITDDDGATHSDTTTVNISGADTTPPVVVHAPVPNGRPAGQAVTVSADVTDASGIAGVTLYYRAIGAMTFSTLPMSNTSGPTYQATLPAAAVNAPGIEYYVTAADNAMPANTASQPTNAPTGYFTFTVTAPPAPTIVHTAIGNGQAQGQAVTISADITAPGGLASATLYFRTQGGGAFSTVALTNTTGSTYQAQIAGTAVAPPAVEYYLEVVDQSTPAQTATQPPGMGSVFSFTVTPSDTSAPSIVHTPIGAGQPAGSPVMVSADVTDPSGVGTVTLYYRVSGSGAFAMVSMTGSGSTYAASIPSGSVTTAGVDYYIEAADQASPANTGTAPAGAPASFNSFTVMRVFNVNAGDLVVSEIMADPSGSETLREWFELYNTTSAAIDIDGFTFTDDGVDTFTVSNGAPLNVPPGGYLVLGRSADTAANGGVTVDYVYSGMSLANTSDEIIIAAGAVQVDRVAYDAGTTFPRDPGKAISLDPNTLDAVSNDSGGSWCSATSPLSGGDFGSPGFANDSCTDTIVPVIVHTPIADGQQANLPVAVSAVVTDGSGLASVEVFYRVAGQGAYTAATMSPIAADVFQGEIPASAVTTTGVEYYVRAVDAAAGANEALEPMTAPTTPHAFMVTTDDTSGPSITHNPVADGQPNGVAVEIIASVADPSGVQSVTLGYRIAGGSWQEETFTALGQDVFRTEIPASAVTEAGVEYYLSAQDTLLNASSLPEAGEAGPYVFTVVTPDTEAPMIVHTPIADDRPADAAVTVTAEITDASGISEARLYFRTSGDAQFISAVMTAAGDDFSADIPAAFVRGAGVDYYIEAIDASADQNTAREPGGAPATVHSFTVMTGGTEDMDPPSLLHIPVADGVAPGAKVSIVAEVVDPSGVAAVTVFYRAQGSTDFTSLALAQVGTTDRYEVDLPTEAVAAPGVQYYLQAEDTVGNAVTRPTDAPQALYSFTVMGSTTDPNPTNPREEDGCRCVRPEAAGPSGLWLAGLGLVWVVRRRQATRRIK